MSENLREDLVDRICELWVRAIRDPVFDNGDNSFRGTMSSAMAKNLSKNPTEEQLENFRKILKRNIMNTEKFESWERISLECDYNPNRLLAEAAAEAELLVKFPWKTRSFICEEHIEFGNNYAGNYKYHYPLKNGRWLITDLRGKDIQNIIHSLNENVPAVWDVEEVKK